MATVICRTLEKTKSDYVPIYMTTDIFSDVPENHWANGYINKVSSLDIATGYGNGRFGPSDYLTYEQAVTMIVRTIGAGSEALGLGGYPDGYLAVADNMGLLSGLHAVKGEALSRANVAVLLFNYLHDGTVPSIDERALRAYEKFIQERGFQAYTDNWEAAPYSYAILDIDQNQIPELLINSATIMDAWYSTLLFTYNPDLNEVILVKDIYHYDDIRYSQNNQAIVYAESRPFPAVGGYVFYALDGIKLKFIQSVGWDTSGDGTYSFIATSGDRRKISFEEREAIFLGLSSIPSEPLPVGPSDEPGDLLGEDIESIPVEDEQPGDSLQIGDSLQEDQPESGPEPSGVGSGT